MKKNLMLPVLLLLLLSLVACGPSPEEIAKHNTEVDNLAREIGLSANKRDRWIGDIVMCDDHGPRRNEVGAQRRQQSLIDAHAKLNVLLKHELADEALEVLKTKYNRDINAPVQYGDKLYPVDSFMD